MIDAIGDSLSGMQANEAWLNATASNIANQQSNGTPPLSGSGGGNVYQPVDTVMISQGNDDGVRATYRPSSPAYQLSHQPDSPDANANGAVATPNVDPVQQSVNEIMSLRAFQFNATSLRASDQMEQATLNLLA